MQKKNQQTKTFEYQSNIAVLEKKKKKKKKKKEKKNFFLSEQALPMPDKYLALKIILYSE